MMDNFRRDIGKRIKFARLELDWQQSDLAAKMGVSQRTVSRWELGKASVSADMLIRLSHVLNKPPEYFLDPFPIRSDAAPIAPRRRAEDWQYAKAAAPKPESEHEAEHQRARKAA